MTWTYNTPLFIYGSLQPGEPPYRFLDPYVRKSSEATLDNFKLFVRDGLPFISQTTADAECAGFLIYPREDSFEGFKRIVSLFELPSHYQLSEVSIRSGRKMIRAKTNIGLMPEVGNAVECSDKWSMNDDPLLAKGLEVSRKILVTRLSNLKPIPAEMDNYWEQMIPLIGIYLFLWTVVERLTTLLYGKGFKMGERIFFLEQEIFFSKILNSIESEKVVVTDRNFEQPNSFLESHYAVRNNLSHQGKNGIHDFHLVAEASKDLQTLLLALWDQIPALSSAKDQDLFALQRAYERHQADSSQRRRATMQQITREDL